MIVHAFAIRSMWNGEEWNSLGHLLWIELPLEFWTIKTFLFVVLNDVVFECVWPIFAWDFPWTWRPGGLKDSTSPTTAQKIIHPRRSCYNSQTRSRQAAIWPRHVWGFNKGCLYIPESVGKTWKDNLEVPQRQNINELPPKRIRNRMKYSWECVCVYYIFIFIYLCSMKFVRRWYWQWVPAGDLQESLPQLQAILYLVLRKHSSLLPLLGHEN